MTTYQRGDIVLVPFPFTDLSQRKVRPAVILFPLRFNQRRLDIVLAAISLVIPASPDEFDLFLRQGDRGFTSTGLRMSSVIKASKLVMLDQRLILVTLGTLAPNSMEELEGKVALALGMSGRSTPAQRVE